MTSISIIGIIIAVSMTPSTINTIIVMMSTKIRSSSRLTLTFATIIIVITSIIIITIGAIIDCCC